LRQNGKLAEEPNEFQEAGKATIDVWDAELLVLEVRVMENFSLKQSPYFVQAFLLLLGTAVVQELSPSEISITLEFGIQTLVSLCCYASRAYLESPSLGSIINGTSMIVGCLLWFLLFSLSLQ